jgi:hypothetical protein
MGRKRNNLLQKFTLFKCTSDKGTVIGEDAELFLSPPNATSTQVGSDKVAMALSLLVKLSFLKAGHLAWGPVNLIS